MGEPTVLYRLHGVVAAAYFEMPPDAEPVVLVPCTRCKGTKHVWGGYRVAHPITGTARVDRWDPCPYCVRDANGDPTGYQQAPRTHEGD